MEKLFHFKKKALAASGVFYKSLWSRLLALAAVSLFIGFLLGQGVAANTAPVPGSEDDPLVTASWVEARLRAVAGSGVQPPGQPVYIAAPAPTFKVVSVPAGRKITGAGTELILRAGRARAVGGAGGGLSDLTAGRNLSKGDKVEADHLLLLIKDDGRGVVAETDAIFLVRGEYKIIENQ